VCPERFDTSPGQRRPDRVDVGLQHPVGELHPGVPVVAHPFDGGRQTGVALTQ